MEVLPAACRLHEHIKAWYRRKEKKGNEKLYTYLHTRITKRKKKCMPMSEHGNACLVHGHVDMVFSILFLCCGLLSSSILLYGTIWLELKVEIVCIILYFFLFIFVFIEFCVVWKNVNRINRALGNA